MALIVCKFGGSSVASIERIMAVAIRVKGMRDEGNQLVVVVSAMGDTTDELLELAAGTNNKNNLREMDMLLATGEQQSAALLALTLGGMDCPAISLTGWQAGIYSDDSFSKAKILDIVPERILKELEQEKVVVVAGFQGISSSGDVTTLGRGGSDTTAVALAASIKAQRCKIFTDVDGVYTADPRIVPEASKLASISYEEMLEMASLGAGVMQPRAVECAMQNNVDVEVLNSFNQNLGTIITEVSKMEKQRTISGVADDKNIAKIAVFDVPDKPGTAMMIFNELAKAKINVDMIIQSEVRGNNNDISFTVEKNELEKALPIVNKAVELIGASGMSYATDVAKVSIVGAGMQSNTGIAASMFEALAEANINIKMISTSEIKISCVIDENDMKEAVRILHKKFALEGID